MQNKSLRPAPPGKPSAQVVVPNGRHIPRHNCGAGNEALCERGQALLDSKLATLGPIDLLAAPLSGWIRAIRDAVGVTGSQLGNMLGITPQGVSTLEQSEMKGTIQLRTLRRVADSMDCVLVYALVPKKSLMDTVGLTDSEMSVTRESEPNTNVR